MGRPPSPPTPEEVYRIVDRTERELRRLVGRWTDHIPPQLRAELTRPANRLQRVLIRLGRR